MIGAPPFETGASHLTVADVVAPLRSNVWNTRRGRPGATQVLV
jgi:hypothetical protein